MKNIIACNIDSHVLFLLIEPLKFFENQTTPSFVEPNQELIEHEYNGVDLDNPLKLPNELGKVSSVDIFHGEPYTDRKSTFQAHFARISSMEELEYFKSNVLNYPKVSRATHNILVYRFTKGNLIYHDYDDDGETAAGSRLAEILRLMEVDNIAIIVSRWFGGILLGADRFKIINNTARKLLELHGVIK